MLNLLDITYFVLILILSGFSTIFFIARKRENSVNKLKFTLIFLMVISVIFFIANSLSFLTLSSELLKSSEKVLTSNFMLFLLCFSIGLFIYSLYYQNNDIIELESPSYSELRNGTIKIGRVMELGHKRRNFFLSLKDLEKHMFICGATGTGKTNFLQNLLVNFTKRYNIPFMLVEFKGEYHFLQRKIENLLILRPGENFL